MEVGNQMRSYKHHPLRMVYDDVCVCVCMWGGGGTLIVILFLLVLQYKYHNIAMFEYFNFTALHIYTLFFAVCVETICNFKVGKVPNVPVVKINKCMSIYEARVNVVANCMTHHV